LLSKAVWPSLAAGLLLSASLPAAAEVDGKQLYQQNCVKCHGENGRANTLRGWLSFAQNLSKAKWQERNSDEDIIAAIQEGPGAMPAYAEKLSADEQQALVQYVRGLRQL
jgi:mono/diheme cytochrome c family protein